MGAFPFAAGLQRLLDDFPYPDRLTYLPHAPREEVRTLLQEAAALVQPSEEENFGSSVAEALACGTPVVVGPTNGTGDYILGGGERFADYQVDAVAGAVSTLLDRIDAAPIETRERARRVATDRFSVRSVVDGLEAVIQDVIDRQTEARPLRP
jgi:glycosyltransferase involved in cell wall biosynthesis